MMLPIGDNCVKCEAHSQNLAEVVDFEKMLLGDYDLHHPLSFSSPSVASLQTPALFSMCTSKRNLGNGDGLIYTGETRPALAEPTIAPDLEKWMAAQAPTIGYDGTLRSSKRLRTVTAGTQHHRLQYSVTPRKQPLKAPCRRSQKLGDKITALQQLVSPFGKTDTASVLQEAATCIRLLHEQIQILTAPYPGMSSSSFQQDTVEVTTDLRRRGLCLAPISTAVVSLVSESACDRRYTEMEDQRRWFGGV